MSSCSLRQLPTRFVIWVTEALHDFRRRMTAVNACNSVSDFRWSELLSKWTLQLCWIFKDNDQWNRSRSRNKKATHNLLSCYITPKDGFRSYIYKTLTSNPCKMTLTLVSRISGFKRNSLLYWTVERLVNCKSAAWLDLKIPHLWEPIEAVGTVSL